MKTITLKPFVLCLAVAGLCQIASAQSDLKLPDVSQAAEAKQRIALTDITVKYHRPLVNGRKIWGGLVPYGKVWRAGADENTTIELSDDVSVEGKPLPKGVYGLHMIPNQDSWTVIFSNEHGVGKLQLRPERRCFARGCETPASRRAERGARIRV